MLYNFFFVNNRLIDVSKIALAVEAEQDSYVILEGGERITVPPGFVSKLWENIVHRLRNMEPTPPQGG